MRRHSHSTLANLNTSATISAQSPELASAMMAISEYVTVVWFPDIIERVPEWQQHIQAIMLMHRSCPCCTRPCSYLCVCFRASRLSWTCCIPILFEKYVHRHVQTCSCMIMLTYMYVFVFVHPAWVVNRRQNAFSRNVCNQTRMHSRNQTRTHATIKHVHATIKHAFTQANTHK